MNAYVAADCGTIKTKNSKETYIRGDDDDFNDDYLGIFYDHQCCSSLRSHYYEYCDDTGLLNEFNLLVVAGVMLLCECAKSIVKKNNIRFLPEAAACMLVGMACALGADFFGSSIESFSFDEQIFMYLLLPPIIFEAALTVNKKEFRRRRGSIMVFAVLGTLLSSFVTGTITFYSAKYLGDVPLDLLDSLVFGTLISSIDPVAILSVLTSLNMSETDTIYIIVFGESLLNDGVAITLFKSLLEHYHNTSTSFDDILGSVADFLIIAFGSCAIGLTCGVACLCYFHLNSSILHPVMEVASFFLWAVIPYWMAEAFEWSGIVAIVCMGFFMDIYLRPGWDPEEVLREDRQQLMYNISENNCNDDSYHNMDDESDPKRFRFRGTAIDIPRPIANRTRSVADGEQRTSLEERIGFSSQEQEHDASDNVSRAGTSITATPNVKALLMKKETVRLSREADEHVRFVAHILSQMSENAIFAYLGLFLFSSKYEWDAILCSIGITSCILSRAIMVLTCSWFIWYLHVIRQRTGCEKRRVLNYVDDSSSTPKGSNSDDEKVDPNNTPISKSARALSNAKVQVVLILAGLRGAVSLALVESIPIYNGVTGIGSKNKPLLKAMTSSAIIFTIFVLGGGAYYILKWLDISSDDMLVKDRNKSANARDFLYPTLYCGDQTSELEMAAGAMTPPPAPRSFSEANMSSSATSPRSRPRYLRDGYVMPSPRPSTSRLLEYSLSEDTRASSTAGLNPIFTQNLSVDSDIVTVSKSKDEDRRRNLV
jgi:NhaP-type Na+/H+ or K+/H+ antiporter